MIKSRDALLLARTKLKTRRIRLIITVIITSLLFSILTFLAILSSGIINSLNSFGEEGYGSRFIVQASPLTYSFGGGPDDNLTKTFGPIQADMIARKKAEAKRLNLTYEERSDQSLPLQNAETGAGVAQVYPNFASPLITDYFEKKNQAIAGTDFSSFSKLARSAGAKETYRGTQNGFMSMGGPTDASANTSVLVEGKETIQDRSRNQGGPEGFTGVNSLTTLGWRSADMTLLDPFLLAGQSLVTGRDGSVPIIAPLSAAEEILGLKALPQTAAGEEKIIRLSKVRKEIAGQTVQLCYRNGASNRLLQQAVEQQKEMTANKNKKDYSKPSLIYKVPTEPCGGVVIASDTRKAEEKKIAADQKAFDEKFGQSQTPEQGIVTVRIVGLNPDMNVNFSISLTAILASLLTSSVGSGWVSPVEAISINPLAAKMQGGTVATVPRTQTLYYAEFTSVKDLESFVKSQTCDAFTAQPGPNGGFKSPDEFTKRCIDTAKVYSVQPYGNSAAAVEQFKNGVWKVARIAIIVIVVIAALIMMGNVGKIIADSRRETSVFRALGAKRFDITQIYLTYTILVGLLVAVSSLIIGFLIASYINNRVAPDLSVVAVLAYNARDVNKQFLLFGFNPLWIGAIVGLILVAGILSAVLPLLANTRRNPIHDMRDDT